MAVRNPSAEARTDQQDGRAEFSSAGDKRRGGRIFYWDFATNRSRGEGWHRETCISNGLGPLGVAMRSVAAVRSPAFAPPAIG